MSERRSIGEILKDVGRIDEKDVERALQHQEEHGGYFGEALIALGVLTAEELEWSLASQFDLPYIFPEAESVDPDAVALVSPEWALAHMALPIMKTDTTLTVVVDSPTKSKALEDLHARTDREIELALASARNIRDLIRQVFARRVEEEEAPERLTAVGLDEGFNLALEASSHRFGVSARGHRAWFWYDEDGTVVRRPLEVTWSDQLDKLMSPPPSEHLEGRPQATLEAELSREGTVSAVEVRFLSDESGREYLFRPIRQYSKLHDRFPPPPGGIVQEVRLLARTGSARFLVRGSGDLTPEILPHLPALLLDPTWRCVHVTADEAADSDDVFSMVVAKDPDEWASEAEALRHFHFDAVTADTRGTEDSWGLAALEVAAVVFMMDSGIDPAAAHGGGIRWVLSVHLEEGEHIRWELEPLQV